MSKKKAFTGSTMTLKDFHGGSIPSDLPLPSAPGVVVRPSDRPGYQASWGNPMGRSDHRLRPGSAGSASRNLDEKTPFLTHVTHIGRNFDEDERKPLDGVSVPRRMVSDESIHVPYQTEVKADSGSVARVSSRPASSSVAQIQSGNSGSYAARFAEGGSSAASAAVNSPSFGGNGGQAVVGGSPNAWGVRKEVVTVVGVTENAGQVSVTKFAQASALEKVSSGRWQSKHVVQQAPVDVEVTTHSETESGFYSNHNNSNVRGGERSDGAFLRNVEWGVGVEEGVRVGGAIKEFSSYERVRSPVYSEARNRNSPLYLDGARVASNDVKFGGSELQPPVPSEASERPKLKLLPRSKPLEGLEHVGDFKQQVHQQQIESVPAETFAESYGDTYSAKQGLGGSENGSRVIERPKLNLKPRTQPVEKLEGTVERERKSLFGGARPRELVLKERGADDVAVNNQHEIVQSPNRVKQDVPKAETHIHAISGRHNEKAENSPLDHRIVKSNERKDQRVDEDRADMQRRNWRNDNRNNNRDIEKQHQHQERAPSPETWRKPVEQPKLSSPDGAGLRYGKAASAVELAQAFSRSVSDPKTPQPDQFLGQRGVPSRAQIPFSRLTGPTPRPQINGY